MKHLAHFEATVNTINESYSFNINEFVGFFEDLEVKKMGPHNRNVGDIISLDASQEVLVPTDQKLFLEFVYVFISTCEFLLKGNMIHVVDFPNMEVKPICVWNENLKEFYPFERYYYIAQNYLKKEIIPLPALDDFINRGYKTESEDRTEKEVSSRKRAQKWTITIAVISILINVISFIYQNMNYKTERVVTVKNYSQMTDSLRVRLTEPIQIKNETSVDSTDIK